MYIYVIKTSCNFLGGEGDDSTILEEGPINTVVFHNPRSFNSNHASVSSSFYGNRCRPHGLWENAIYI